MSRRLSWIAALTAALLFAAAAPAAAVGPFEPAHGLIGAGLTTPTCVSPAGEAAIAVDGTTRVLGSCANVLPGRIWFVRVPPGSVPAREPTPYIGRVLSVAWDGVDATYVLYLHSDSQVLMIGKRVESSGVYAPATTLSTSAGFQADVVASAGRWWAVWSEQVGPGGEFAQTELFQRHTLLGVQGRTRITTTASNIDDSEPTLAYANGRVTMVWTRATNPAVPGPADLRIAESTGGAWLSRPFASLGDLNHDADLTTYAGVTWVTWGRDGRIVVANNSGGTFHSRTFATTGDGPTVAVSGSHAFVAWTADQASRAFVAELSAGTWTGTQVAGAGSFSIRVLAQGTKARAIYGTENRLFIRTQT